MYPEYGQTTMTNMASESSSSRTELQPQWFNTVLQRIGDEVTSDEYLTFGLKLGVPQEMSKNIRTSKEDAFPDTTIALLRQWMRKLGFSPEQLADELVKALNAVRLGGLAYTIHEEIKNHEDEWRTSIQPNKADTLSKRLESQIVTSDDVQETGGRGSKSGDNRLAKRKNKPKANYLIQPHWKFY